MKNIVIFLAMIMLNQTIVLAQIQEDIVSVPSASFLNVGIRNAATLVTLPNCDVELLLGAISDGSGAGSFRRFQRQSNSFWRDLGKTTRANGVAGTDHYGRALASTTINDTVLLAVGAPQASGGGLVEIFRYDQDSNDWLYQQTLSLNDASITDASAEFGFALSMQGSRLLVGMPGRDANKGGMVLYEYNNGQFNYVRSHVSPTPESRAGESAALSWPDYAVGMPGLNSMSTSPGGLLGYFDVYLPSTKLRAVRVEIGGGLTEATPGQRCGSSITAAYDKSPSQFYIGCGPTQIKIFGLRVPESQFVLPLYEAALVIRHPDGLFNEYFGAALSYTPVDGGKLLTTNHVSSSLSPRFDKLYVFDYDETLDSNKGGFAALSTTISSPVGPGPQNYGSDVQVSWPFVSVGMANGNALSTPASPNANGAGGDGSSGKHVIYNMIGTEPNCKVADDSLCFVLVDSDKKAIGSTCL